VLGSLGFILLLVFIIGGICYKCKSSLKTTKISTFSRVPYTNNNHLEIQWSYNSPSIDDRTISRSIDYPRTRTRDISSFYIT